MLRKIRRYMENQQMISKGDKIVLGLSGGADSVALFLLLNELKEEYELNLFAVHVNHGIRKEAGEDADYAKELCEKFAVPFFLFEADISEMAKKQGKSEEEMGREFRYQCFNEVMEKEQADKIAVAHHMDDKVETVLFHLLRGTDLTGMSGIRPVNGKIIRPLLSCRKEELITWLTEQKVAWKEDVTNGDNDYARNKIRNQILPLLTEINKQAVKHIAEYADSITEYDEYFCTEVSDYLASDACFKDGYGEISLHILLMNDRILALRIIYEMMAQVCGEKKNISKEHVLSVYELLRKQIGKKVDLPYQMEAYITYRDLIIRKCSKEDEESFCWYKEIDLDTLKSQKEKKTEISLPDGTNIILEIMDSIEELCINPYTKSFDCGTIGDTLCFRTPEAEDYIIINKDGRRKKLSRYFIDEKIPAAERKKQIVAAIGHEVLYVVGGRRCENYHLNQETKEILSLTYGGISDGLPYRRITL